MGGLWQVLLVSELKCIFKRNLLIFVFPCESVDQKIVIILFILLKRDFQFNNIVYIKIENNKLLSINGYI